MAYTAEQQRIANRIKSIGRRRGASPMEVKSGLETGLVESNLRDLPGGDRDSTGWRQERSSLYPRDGVDASINRYFNETGSARKRGRFKNAGELAAAVQRPAAQYRGRYQERSAEADALLGRSAGSPTPAPAPGAPRPAASNSRDRAAILQGYLARRGQPGAIDSLYQQLRDVDAPAGKRAGDPAATPHLALDHEAVAAGQGAFKITGPNPGRVKSEVTDFMRSISAVRGGRAVVGSDGTGHSRLTTSGNVSEHTTGNASDIPASGHELVALGQAALIAAGMPRAQARKQQGGLFNVTRNGRRYQIIFNTHEGGDHTDHLHVGVH